MQTLLHSLTVMILSAISFPLPVSNHMRPLRWPANHIQKPDQVVALENSPRSLAWLKGCKIVALPTSRYIGLS